jgi:hypothetical protein
VLPFIVYSVLVSQKIEMLGSDGPGDKLFRLINPAEYAYLHEHYPLILLSSASQMVGDEAAMLEASLLHDGSTVFGGQPQQNNLNDIGKQTFGSTPTYQNTFHPAFHQGGYSSSTNMLVGGMSAVNPSILNSNGNGHSRQQQQHHQLQQLQQQAKKQVVQKQMQAPSYGGYRPANDDFDNQWNSLYATPKQMPLPQSGLYFGGQQQSSQQPNLNQNLYGYSGTDPNVNAVTSQFNNVSFD